MSGAAVPLATPVPDGNADAVPMATVVSSPSVPRRATAPTHRAPTQSEAQIGALACAALAVGIFAGLCYPELRKNMVFEPATCQPYVNDILRPEIRPYRHCYQSCTGCRPAYSSTTCGFKMGMHYQTNEYNMEASMWIAGSCAGSSCCAQEVCNKCSRTETRCSRRRLLDRFWEASSTTELPPSAGENESATSASEEEEGWEDDEEEEGVAAPWASSLRRQLDVQAKTCRDVTSTYDCNCRCVRRVARKQCSIHCLPYWRSFIPIRISLPYAAEGFYRSSQDPTPRQALRGFKQVLSVNGTTETQRKERLNSVNRTDLSSGHFVETAETFSVTGYEGYSFSPGVDDGFSRVVTLVYQHGASRRKALDKLRQPWFYPGVVSECYYEPDWDPHSSFVPSGHVAFSHEMGYRLWKWLLLLLALAGVGVSALLYVKPDAFGGEVVVGPATVVMHGNVAVHKDNTWRGYSMW
jgi:hypothetical protein